MAATRRTATFGVGRVTGQIDRTVAMWASDVQPIRRAGLRQLFIHLSQGVEKLTTVPAKPFQVVCMSRPIAPTVTHAVFVSDQFRR